MRFFWLCIYCFVCQYKNSEIISVSIEHPNCNFMLCFNFDNVTKFMVFLLDISTMFPQRVIYNVFKYVCMDQWSSHCLTHIYIHIYKSLCMYINYVYSLCLRKKINLMEKKSNLGSNWFFPSQILTKYNSWLSHWKFS